MQKIFPHVEGQPLLSRFLDGQHRLAGEDVLANLGDNHADDAVSRRAQNGFLQAALENGECGCSGLYLRVRDGALLLGRTCLGRSMIGFRLSDIGARARDIVRGLIDRLLRGGVATPPILRLVRLGSPERRARLWGLVSGPVQAAAVSWVSVAGQALVGLRAFVGVRARSGGWA